MRKLEIFCICLNNELLDIVNRFNYIPVGLGEGNFSNQWIRDNTKKYRHKNKYYGEHSFHYWFGKINLILKKKINGLGFVDIEDYGVTVIK